LEALRVPDEGAAGSSLTSGGTFTVEREIPSALLSGLIVLDVGRGAFLKALLFSSGALEGSLVLKLKSIFLKNRLNKIIKMTNETATVEKNRMRRFLGPMGVV